MSLGETRSNHIHQMVLKDAAVLTACMELTLQDRRNENSQYTKRISAYFDLGLEGTDC